MVRFENGIKQNNIFVFEHKNNDKITEYKKNNNLTKNINNEFVI